MACWIRRKVGKLGTPPTLYIPHQPTRLILKQDPSRSSAHAPSSHVPVHPNGDPTLKPAASICNQQPPYPLMCTSNWLPIYSRTAFNPSISPSCATNLPAPFRRTPRNQTTQLSHLCAPLPFTHWLISAILVQPPAISRPPIAWVRPRQGTLVALSLAKSHQAFLAADTLAAKQGTSSNKLLPSF